jgi:hypothetical protein
MSVPTDILTPDWSSPLPPPDNRSWSIASTDTGGQTKIMGQRCSRKEVVLISSPTFPRTPSWCTFENRAECIVRKYGLSVWATRASTHDCKRRSVIAHRGEPEKINAQHLCSLPWISVQLQLEANKSQFYYLPRPWYRIGCRCAMFQTKTFHILLANRQDDADQRVDVVDLLGDSNVFAHG